MYYTYILESEKLNIAEIGVGSGIISIILSQNLLNSKFYAVDILDQPLETSKINVLTPILFELVKMINEKYKDLFLYFIPQLNMLS